MVLILTQSYTASLTSLLTVQQLQPTETDVNELIKNGKHVGYKNGSFVYEMLKGMGFDNSKLIPFSSPEECDGLFSKSRGSEAIAAAFDEVLYTKLFLSRYCTKYTVINPIYKTDGFGFVFPKRSPLVPDISRAILNVTEGDKMKRIEEAWLGKQSDCPDAITSISSNSLSLDCFWGLFLIAGIVSVVALIIFIAMFLYENREALIRSDPSPSTGSKILILLRIFNQRDLRSHTLRKNVGIHLPDLNAPSPSSFSVHTDFSREPTSPVSGDLNEQPPQAAEINANQVNPTTREINHVGL